MNKLKKYGLQVIVSSGLTAVKLLRPILQELSRIPFAQLDIKARAEGKSAGELNWYFLCLFLLVLFGYFVSFQIAICLDTFFNVANSGQLMLGLILFSISCVVVAMFIFSRLYEIKPSAGAVAYDQSESAYGKAKALIYLFLSCLIFGFVLVNCALILFSVKTLGPLWWAVPSAYSVFVMITVSSLKKNVVSLEAVSKELPETNRKKKLLNIACKSGFANVVLYRLPESRTLKGCPVFLSSSGGLPRIFFAPQVLELCSDDELVTVVAHELGHLKQRHRLSLERIRVFLEILSWCLVAAALSVIPHSSDSCYMILPIIFGLMGLFRGINECTTKFVGRFFETEADLYALNVTGDSVGLKNAITKIEQIAAMNVQKCDSFFVSIFSSHPSLKKRIDLATRWEKKNLNG